MSEVKMYANPGCFHITDQEVITQYTSLMLNAKMFGEDEGFKQAFRSFCSHVRSLLDINNVISFAALEDASLLVLTYDVFAQEGKELRQGYDEKGSFVLLTV